MATYPRRSIATRNRNTRSSTITHCRNLIEISFTREGFFRFHIFLYAHLSIMQPIRTPTMNPVILFTISNTAAAIRTTSLPSFSKEGPSPASAQVISRRCVPSHRLIFLKSNLSSSSHLLFKPLPFLPPHQINTQNHIQTACIKPVPLLRKTSHFLI